MSQWRVQRKAIYFMREYKLKENLSALLTYYSKYPVALKCPSGQLDIGHGETQLQAGTYSYQSNSMTSSEYRVGVLLVEMNLSAGKGTIGLD